jgi:peptidoglycan/xylan/chitin deacetylase (PgdA/CDA1 family)
MTGAISLMYHDVIDRGSPDASGFPSGDAAIYKLPVEIFRSHLQAIQQRAQAVSHVGEMHDWEDTLPVLLTFDDGGASFLDPIAGMLEEFGWRGHFFITTDYIDSLGFLSRADIRDLHDRGHIIGSHSCSHPMRMSACTRQQLKHEWSESVAILSDIVGSAITTASVPGGWYSRQVTQTAAESGISVLFNSEPKTRAKAVDRTTVFGRFAMFADTPASVCGAFAAGERWLIARQKLVWNAKKALKATGGELYVTVRKALLNR